MSDTLISYKRLAQIVSGVYWSDVYPLKSALNAIDDYISRFRLHPLWITEASRNLEEGNQVRSPRNIFGSGESSRYGRL